MGRKKKLPHIEVRTVANGYSLAIEGHRQEYMYFSPEKLMEGVMVHIGLHMTDQLSPETIKSFIDSALEWNNIKTSHKEITRLNAEVERLSKLHRGVCKRLIEERNRMLHLCELANECTLGHHSLTDSLARLHTQVHKDRYLKRFTLKDFGIKSKHIIDDGEEED